MSENTTNLIWQARFEKKRNWLKAVELLEQCIAENPGDFRAYEELAGVYHSKSLYKKAIEIYHKALEINQEDDNILFRIGNCYLSLNELNISLYYYEKIRDPFPESNYNKAIVYSRLGRYEECIQILEDVVFQQPESELPYYFLIEQYLNQKLFEKSIELLHKMEIIFGKRSKIHYLRGVSFSYQKNWLRAFIEYQHAQKLGFTSAGFFRAYGIAAEKIGKTVIAIDLLLESIKSEPYNIATYLDLINIYISHGRLREANKIVEHAKRIGPFTSSLSLIHNKIKYLMKASEENGGDEV